MTTKINVRELIARFACIVLLATPTVVYAPPPPPPPPSTNYTINASAGPNGSVSPSSVTVSAGDSATFTATPDYSYEVDTWFLDDIVFQSGGTTCTISQIEADHSLYVTFRAAQVYSLGGMGFEDEQEYENRTVNNNKIDPDRPEQSRNHVERVTGVGPDPDNAAMRMRNLKDLDPVSPTYGKIIHARVKGKFYKTDADEILVRFAYLFETAEPGVELKVYLSDSAELLTLDDPSRPAHYVMAGILAAPPFSRPGAVGSNRFGLFEKRVWAGHLNFAAGLYIELELTEPQSGGVPVAHRSPGVFNASGNSSVLVDDWNPEVQCYGICLDINWDNFVDEADFLVVIGASGCSATGEMACFEGALSTDGYMDPYDVVSWDWALHSDQRLLNYCGVPLAGPFATVMSPARPGAEDLGTVEADSQLSSNLGDLLIAGKSGAPDAHSKLKDSLYIFDTDGSYGGSFETASDRCNIRLLQGPGGEIYQLNAETGLHRLDAPSEVVIPPGEMRLTHISEPRYNGSATVYVGLQGNDSDAFGRPLLDVAFDAEHVYVVPVVVDPDGGEPYMAAAKLRLIGQGNPPYELVRLYDDPPLPNDNQYRNHLREIELDGAGNLYVLNVHAINESDILWRYAADGAVERVDLGRTDGDRHVPAPIAMCASKATPMLYLASAVSDPADSETAIIFGFSTQGTLVLEKRITISGLHHITCLTEDPQTGTLWVAGFNMYNIPPYPDPRQQAFYYPYMASIPPDSDQQGGLTSLYEPDIHDLGLPMSILWTHSAGQDDMKLHGLDSDSVNLSDMATLAACWLD